MPFLDIGDKEVRGQLTKRLGIARPAAQDYLMDFMSVAPMMLGMPMMSGRVKVPGVKKLVKPKVGDTIKTSHGRVKFDGVQEGFGTIPKTYMYTFREGIAKDGSFVSKTQELASIEAAAKKLTDVWKNFNK